ncbi:HNH endonuclease [Arthrobacter sp. FW305-BF8]|uniref:HNH endonuclease signature motif containing protein n=1 Tax=Arthrobacter sp. FW305-BF8 TaxID=2879617 RepID=UPI001F17C4CC|nr:HNH endonuclease signature motif containing protein [Arthrobacter sp. FW305-BF8]UKA52399.1 HNH endonuclease [Arthrobacter sp. FW305-BF8]
MEAVGGFTEHRALGPGAGGLASEPVSVGANALQSVPVDGGARVLEGDVVDQALALLEPDAITAEDAALWGFGQAADFADRLEQLSRRVERLQVVAAGAVDRSRIAALTAAASSLVAVPASDTLPGDDGFRNSVEFLRDRLRISSAEARRRIGLADAVLPRTGFGGQQLPPRYGELAAAVGGAQISSRAATTITLALDRARHFTTPDHTAAMEHDLTLAAVENDADFLTRVAKHWAEAIDQDGTEPSEAALRQIQGAFIRRPKHGLQHLEIFATAEQFETITTVMNTATNPRTPAPGDGPSSDGPGSDGPSSGAGSDGPGNVEPAGLDGWATDGVPEISLDHRSQGQKRLDGLVGALQTVLTTDTLPANGGHRPQILATINYRDLLADLQHRQDAQWAQNAQWTQEAQWASDLQTAQGGQEPRPAYLGGASRGRTDQGTALFAFGGPVNPATIRKIACDADIIPVVLGGQGRILDIGRASRVFPPHIRKAIMARDQGCAFPGCTIPAAWCEAHHITYWSRGGTTSTGNGVLLCSHHHHLIHKELWHIEVTNEVPWFKPPPELDPHRKPRRNNYFHSRPHRE